MTHILKLSLATSHYKQHRKVEYYPLTVIIQNKICSLFTIFAHFLRLTLPPWKQNKFFLKRLSLQKISLWMDAVLKHPITSFYKLSRAFLWYINPKKPIERLMDCTQASHSVLLLSVLLLTIPDCLNGVLERSWTLTVTL